MKVTVLKHPEEEDWMLCKRCTLVTVGKEPISPPDLEWKKKILSARHSPIRTLQFCFLLEDIPYWVSTHLVRHVHAVPMVRSQRNDRQDKYDRNEAPQSAPVSMAWYMNAEELMTIANKRLCRQSAYETRILIRMICEEVLRTNPEFKELLVPMCEYGRCHEMYPCNKEKESG